MQDAVMCLTLNDLREAQSTAANYDQFGRSTVIVPCKWSTTPLPALRFCRLCSHISVCSYWGPIDMLADMLLS